MDDLQVITTALIVGMAGLLIMVAVILAMGVAALAQRIIRRKAPAPAAAAAPVSRHHRYHGKHRSTGEYPHA